MALRILLLTFGMTWLASNTIDGTGVARAGGTDPVAIVIPSAPAPSERRAADELARYIGLIRGSTLPILNEDAATPGGPVLMVGHTVANLRRYDPSRWARDTIHLGYGEHEVAILGAGPQGTLFAAYEFLRDLGCRWYAPDNVWHDEAFVPRRAALELPAVARRHTPSFVERGWHPHPASSGTWKAHYHDWAVRNGLNTLRGGSEVNYGDDRGWGLQLRGGHTLYVLIPSGDHPEAAATFAAHPQWYPLFEGRRVMQYKDGRPVQACLSQPQVVAQTVARVKSYLRDNPDCYRFSVSPCDEPTYWCECEPCRDMDGPESRWERNDIYDAYGVRSKAGPGPMARRWTTFVNQVAREVGKSHPNVFISFYAYGSTVAPPPGQWRLEPNVMIEYAFGDGVCLRHAEDDHQCPSNSAFHQWLSAWAKSGNPTVLYDYPPTGYRNNIPAAFVRRYASLVRYARALGVTGWAGEGQGSWASAGLWQYVKARLLWDADSDVEVLITEFCDDVYGPAAKPMMAWYQAVESAVTEPAGHAAWGSWAVETAMDTLIKLDGLLKEAEALVITGAEVRNVAMQRVGFNAWVLAWLETSENISTATKVPFDYSAVRRSTQALVEEHAVPVTDVWRDRLFSARYEPPLEALTGQGLVDLRDKWWFRTDPNDVGRTEGWHRGRSRSPAAWRDIGVDDYWTEQGIAYHGVAWYTTAVTIPSHEAHRLWLLFGMIDGEAEIWVDGVSVGTAPAEPWDKPKAFVLPSSYGSGDVATVTVRVEKEIYAAGIKGGVRLVGAGG